jgi:2-polyprenyl-3-methyl-5-hydroxy-6-metoxy-1,4-benzoquinol methylase
VKLSEQARELRKIWSSFQQARVLMTAINYGIFDHLKEPATAVRLAVRKKTDERATEILLDALSGMGLLQKKQGYYKNRSIASRLLVSESPYYQGDIIKHADALWHKWTDLDKIMKSGAPSRRSRIHNSFIMGMHNLSVLKAKDIVNNLDLRGVKRALDLGGGPGTYSIELARKEVEVTLFDTPATIKIAKKVIGNNRGAKNLIGFIGGDFLTDHIGQDYDLIFVSQILHMLSEQANLRLLGKCKKALKKKGMVVVQEFLINSERTRPLWSSLFSVNMLVNTDGGRTYTPEEVKSWLLKLGFESVRKKIVSDGVLVSARK